MAPKLLLVECRDEPGLVHRITGVLLRGSCNVIGNHEFVDESSARFFMRTEFTGEMEPDGLKQEVLALLPPKAQVRVSSLAPRRIVVLCSREHHCLADLLVRHAFGEINATILAVISNHARLGELVARFDLPFHLVSHVDEAPAADPAKAEGHSGPVLSRAEHEQRVLAVLAPYEPEYLVLAKYMRILSAGFVSRFANRIVNIHHSFLPAFTGAKPYAQAFERGVKIIGATAHFVTPELDQGPIIVQEVLPVDHTHGAQELAQAGRDVEKIALARALRLVFEDRVFLCGNRTVIFD